MTFGTRFGTRLGTKIGTQFPNDDGGAPAFSGVVDDLIAAGVTPLAAYSTSHLLYSAYETGPLFNLRRSSDDALQDISHGVDYRTDTAAMATHCGASNGLIKDLYDQTLNGRDITQATLGRQPKIYDSATGVNLQGTLPFAILASALINHWTRGDALGITGASAITIAHFSKCSGFAVRRHMVHVGPAGANGFFAGAESTTGDPMNGVTGVARRNFTETTALTSTSLLVHRIAASANLSASTCRQDGVDLAQSSVVAGVHNITDAEFCIGSDPTRTSLWDGSACFWIVFNADLTGAALTALEDFGTTLRSLD